MAKKGYQFDTETFQIQPDSVNVGPLNFNLTPQIPTDAVITAIDVKTYLRQVETTTYLIDTSVVAPSVAANIVSLYLKWPGSDYTGRHKITFKYTYTSGGAVSVDDADFCCIEVIDI